MLSNPTSRLPPPSGSPAAAGGGAAAADTNGTASAFAPMVARAGRSPAAGRRRAANNAAAAADGGNDNKSTESIRGSIRPVSLRFSVEREEELWRRELGQDFWRASVAIRFIGLPPIQFALISCGVIALTLGRSAANTSGSGDDDISLILSAISLGIQLLLVAALFFWGSNGRSMNQMGFAILFILAGGTLGLSHTISTAPLAIFPSSAGVIVFMLSSLLIARHFLFVYLASSINLIAFIYVVPVIEARWSGGDSSGIATTDILQIILASFVIQLTAREYERVRRSVWVNEQRLREKQQEQATVDRERIALRAEVFGLTLEKFNIAEVLDDKMDFETPIEKTMALLQGVVDHPELPKPLFDKIKEAVLYLGKSNDHLFRPQIEQQLANRKVNEDTARWIRNMIGEGDGKEGSEAGTRVPSATPQRSPVAGRANDDILPGSVPAGIPIVVESKEELAVQTMLQNLDDWNFDIFELMRLTHGKPMLFMGMAVFKKYNLISHFKLDTRKLSAFFEKIERGYNDMPYHNCVHAADVTCSVSYFLGAGRLATYMTEEEILSALVASAIHDHDHPGRNNNYCIAVNDSRALLYNDKSVLENHHLASSFSVLMKEEYNMLSHLPSKTYKNMRKIIIEMVLATDLSHHFDLVGQFQTAIKANFDKKAEKNRLSILRMALKCGDLGHAAKRLDLHLKWTSRYTEESFRQGDDERKHGIPISPFMDRSNFNLPQSQQGFMTFLVLPMYEVFTNFLTQDQENKETLPCLTQMIINRDHWKSEFERGQKQQTRATEGAAPAKTAGAATTTTTTASTTSTSSVASTASVTANGTSSPATTTATSSASTTATPATATDGSPSRRATGNTSVAPAPAPSLIKQPSHPPSSSAATNGGNAAFATVVVAGRTGGPSAGTTASSANNHGSGAAGAATVINIAK